MWSDFVIDTAFVAFVNLIIFFSGLVLACAYLGYGLVNDYRLYFYLKSGRRKRFDEIYSFSARHALLTRVWKYMHDERDMQDKFVVKCKENLRECVKYGAIGIMLIVVSFLLAYLLIHF